MTSREEGLEEELEYWRRVAATGGEWPEDWQSRFDPELPLDEHLVSLIPKPGDCVFLLDVGAGPATTLGKVWLGDRDPKPEVFVTAVDVLADRFTGILRRKPPTVTLQCAGEELSKKFPRDFFDITYARNSVDHMENPVTVIQEMLRVTKPDGAVFLAHRPREGARQKYAGLHRWDFYNDDDGNFFIEGPGVCTNVNLLFEGRAKTRADLVDVDGVPWVHAVLRKHGGAT